jgi:hypothetical protein
MRIRRFKFSIAMVVSLAQLALLGFICGCETVGAMSTGRMTKEDVGYIVKAGAPGKKSPPVQVDSLNVDDGYTISSHPMARWREAWRKVAAVDPWIEEKLW